jgi:hypothetical protein
MESIEAGRQVIKKADDGEQLTWPRVAQLLQKIPDVRDMVSKQITEAEDPIGEAGQQLDIFQMPQMSNSDAASPRPKARATAVQISPERTEPAQTGSESSQDSSEPSTESESHSDSESDAAPPRKKTTKPQQERLLQITTFQMFLDGHLITAHGARDTVHIMRDAETTMCGEDINNWPSQVDVEPEQVVDEKWPLCGNPSCFKEAEDFAPQIQACRRRSGR